MARAPFHRAVPGKTRRTGHCSLERCPVYRALPFKARTVNKGGPLVSPIGLHGPRARRFLRAVPLQALCHYCLRASRGPWGRRLP